MATGVAKFLAADCRCFWESGCNINTYTHSHSNTHAKSDAHTDADLLHPRNMPNADTNTNTECSATRGQASASYSADIAYQFSCPDRRKWEHTHWSCPGCSEW